MKYLIRGDKMRINLFKNNNGMTLIEILLAIALIGIIVVTFLPIVANSYINVINYGDRIKKMYETNGKLEEAIASKGIDVDGIIFENSVFPIQFGKEGKKGTIKIEVNGKRSIKDGTLIFIPH